MDGVKKDLQLMAENQQLTGINVSAFFDDTSVITSSKMERKEKTSKSTTSVSKEDLINGIAEDGEPLW